MRDAMKRLLRRTAVFLCLTVPGVPAWGQQSPFFVQLADTQFGAFTSDRDFAQESSNYAFVVDNLNRLRPDFVVICGDLVNKVGDAEQIDEYFRITEMIDPAVPVYAVSGNHDVEVTPTAESLAAYRDRFGPDYYSFQESGIYGIVLNSSLIGSPDEAVDEARRQEEWLERELEAAQASGSGHIVVFQHHSWFIEDPEEPDQYFNIAQPQRERYLGMLKAAGVRYVFAGHYHRNAYGSDGDLQMITTGPVGLPLGNDPSGIRIVEIHGDELVHTYYPLGLIPNQVR